MRIGTLAAGLAAGYVLGARAGREKYDQIAAAARRVSARSGGAQAEPDVASLRSEARSATAPAVTPAVEPATPAVTPAVEPSTPAGAGTKPRRQRNRRPKAAAATATPATVDETPAMSTADLGLDDLPMEAAEADVVEQHMPVVDHSDESTVTPVPLESDGTDAREQRRSS